MKEDVLSAFKMCKHDWGNLRKTLENDPELQENITILNRKFKEKYENFFQECGAPFYRI